MQVFTYGVSEQQQLKVLYGGDGAVSNQLHQGCRQRVPLKHMRIYDSICETKEIRHITPDIREQIFENFSFLSEALRSLINYSSQDLE